MTQAEEIKQLKERLKQVDYVGWEGYAEGLCRRIFDLERQLKEKEAHCLELVQALKPFQGIYSKFPHQEEAFKDKGFLRFLDSNVVVQGKDNLTKGDFRRVDDVFNSPSAKRYEAILEIVEAAKTLVKYDPATSHSPLKNALSTLEELEKE